MAARAISLFFDERSEVRKKGDSSLSRLMSELSPVQKERQQNDVDRKNPLKRPQKALTHARQGNHTPPRIKRLYGP
jgi:hypothetical protein